MGDQYSETREFLQTVIGCYYEINIVDNNPTCTFYINEEKVKNKTLSDNARCYTEYSVPNTTLFQTVPKLFDGLCKAKKMPNMTVFLSLGDFPIIMKDKTTHPMFDRYIGQKFENIYPKSMPRILSYSKIPSLHDDVLMPTRDFVSNIFDNSATISELNTSWKRKKNIAIFRGSFTGNDRTINNTRIQSKIWSKKYPDLLDVHIFDSFNYYMFDPDLHSPVHTKLVRVDIFTPNGRNNMTIAEQSNHKYILHIDGFTAAWRMSLEMFTGSLILKVDSPWMEHFYHELKPWIHYVPIKADLSDLVQRILWCKENDDICEIIANNALNYARENFTKEKTYDYMEKILCDPTFDPYNMDIKYVPPLFDITLPILPESNFTVDLNFVNYVNKLLNVSKSCILRKEKHEIIKNANFYDFITLIDTLKLFFDYMKTYNMTCLDRRMFEHESLLMLHDVLNSVVVTTHDEKKINSTDLLDVLKYCSFTREIYRFVNEKIPLKLIHFMRKFDHIMIKINIILDMIYIIDDMKKNELNEIKNSLLELEIIASSGLNDSTKITRLDEPVKFKEFIKIYSGKILYIKNCNIIIRKDDYKKILASEAKKYGFVMEFAKLTSMYLNVIKCTKCNTSHEIEEYLTLFECV